MKNQILTFLLGVFVTISVAFTTTNLMTVKPEKPTHVVIQTYNEDRDIVSNMRNFIRIKVSEGYILKSISMTPDIPFSQGIVVMEKY